VQRIDCILRFAPVKEDLHHFLFDLEEPLEHVKELFTCLLRNEIANFRAPDGTPVRDVPGGSYAILRRERRRLNDDIEAFCHGEIGAHYGVRFNGVDLADILPPDELAEALNAMFQAQSEAEALLARAEAEREQRLLAARKGVEIARQNARAAEEEILGLAVFLRALDLEGTLDDYVRRRRVEVLSECGALYLKTDDRRPR
jgi:regulator of protease activity HflC (stomatin/prohibitin superfamily)